MASLEEHSVLSLQITHDEADTILRALCFVSDSPRSDESFAEKCAEIWSGLVS